jgi:hypothetical protein
MGRTSKEYAQSHTRLVTYSRRDLEWPIPICDVEVLTVRRGLHDVVGRKGALTIVSGN